MKVSIIIVSFNAKDELAECLNSLRTQDFKDKEVIVLDNGSLDGTRQMVKESYPEVKLIAYKYNVGFAVGANRAAEQAQGEILALMNQDMVADSKWIGNLIKRLEEPEVGTTTSKIILQDDTTKINSLGTFVSVLGFSGSIGDGNNLTDIPETEPFAPCGGAMAIRKSLWDKLGGFYEPFWMYEDDVDLGWRVRNLGYRNVLASEAIVYHKYRIARSDNKYYFINRNKLWSYWKNARTVDLAWLFPIGNCFSAALTFGFMLQLKFGRAIATMRGVLDSLKKLPSREGIKKPVPFLGLFDTIKIAGRKFKKHFGGG